MPHALTSCPHNRGNASFVAYVALCFRVGRASRLSSERVSTSGQFLQAETGGTRCPTLACRAGALALLVAFWFYGGLFTLATAAVFWILLELGTSNLAPDRKLEARP